MDFEWWRHIPVLLAFKRLWQEDCEFRTRLNYIWTHCQREGGGRDPHIHMNTHPKSELDGTQFSERQVSVSMAAFATRPSTGIHLFNLGQFA